mmetsp:Transcript_15163/g.37162  ORF Transcript_15163/g.37162 Transcript_15163/m.37162 type:complete len:245 (-) Transcript_15163:805-1539(-)
MRQGTRRSGMCTILCIVHHHIIIWKLRNLRGPIIVLDFDFGTIGSDIGDPASIPFSLLDNLAFPPDLGGKPNLDSHSLANVLAALLFGQSLGPLENIVSGWWDSTWFAFLLFDYWCCCRGFICIGGRRVLVTSLFCITTSICCCCCFFGMTMAGAAAGAIGVGSSSSSTLGNFRFPLWFGLFFFFLFFVLWCFFGWSTTLTLSLLPLTLNLVGSRVLHFLFQEFPLPSSFFLVTVVIVIHLLFL